MLAVVAVLAATTAALSLWASALLRLHWQAFTFVAKPLAANEFERLKTAHPSRRLAAHARGATNAARKPNPLAYVRTLRFAVGVPLPLLGRLPLLPRRWKVTEVEIAVNPLQVLDRDGSGIAAALAAGMAGFWRVAPDRIEVVGVNLVRRTVTLRRATTPTLAAAPARDYVPPRAG